MEYLLILYLLKEALICKIYEIYGSIIVLLLCLKLNIQVKEEMGRLVLKSN